MKISNEVNSFTLDQKLAAKGPVKVFGLDPQTVYQIKIILPIIALSAIFFPFMKTAILALIFAFAYEGCKEKLKFFSKKKRIAILSVATLISLCFLGIFASMFSAFFNLFVSMSNPDEITGLKRKISALLLPAYQIVEKYFVRFDNAKVFEDKISVLSSDLTNSVFSYALKIASDMPETLLQLAFLIFFGVFMVRKIKNYKSISMQNFAEPEDLLMSNFISSAEHSGFSAVVTTLLTGFCQAAILTAGAAFVGISTWPMIFVASFVFAMFPVFGIFPIALMCSVYAYSELGVQSALVISFFGVLATLVDNVLRPLLVSGSDSPVNSVLSFFALLGAMIVFGFHGIFIGPFLLALAASLMSNKYSYRHVLRNGVQFYSNRRQQNIKIII